MQITGAQKRRVAIFFLFGIGIIILLTAVLVGNKLLKREDCYYSRFTDISVAGLTEGSSVKFQGMNIGHVSAISIDHENTEVVQIEFCLKPGVPIKEGTMAQLGNIGITGLKFLELQGGGQGKDIPVGGEIPSMKSGWDEITGKATVVAEKLESILNTVNIAIKGLKKEDVESIVHNIDGISGSVNVILKENKNDIRSIVSRVDVLLKEVNSNMSNISAITKNVKDLTSPEGSITKTLLIVEDTVRELNKDYKEADIKDKIDKMFALVETTQKTIDTVNLTLERSKENIDTSLTEMSEGMSNFSEFTRIIMENPSALFNAPKSGEVE
ncbi:MAG TPA: MlaD family protein [bacterium]|nr:MlaD family protein [bacterium]HPV21130.1 MlaD family protein [bacterium]HPY14218.1 MlaD family protein [bacterium]